MKKLTEEMVKIFPLLTLLPIVFLAGCVSPLGYNPPKYVCDCKIVCKTYSGELVEYSYPAGNNTIEDTKADCLRYATTYCPKENIVSYTCNPVTWDEWNKMKAKERQSSGRMP
jgi:hypothetical protein